MDCQWEVGEQSQSSGGLASRRMGTLDFLILKIIMSHRRASEAITARRSERLRSEHELSLREGWVSARW